MRKFSAHRIYPVSGSPVDFGIVETTDDGTIVALRDTGGKPVEEHNLEFYPGIIVPGFVNAHLHLELSHMAGIIPERTGLAGFIAGVTGKRAVDKDLIIKAAQDADRVMYLEGISGAGDISNTVITLPVKRDSRIRYHTFIEVFSLDSNMADARITEALAMAEGFGAAGLECSLAPHAPYSVGTRLWELLADQKELTRLVSMHCNESPEESELLEFRTGPLADRFRLAGMDLSGIPPEADDPFALLQRYLPGSDWLLVHNVAGKIPSVGDSQISYVFCPRSNLYISGLMPDPMSYHQKGFRVCLGTDSLASNHSLSVLEEMKAISVAYPALPFVTILHWATLGGASALGFDNELGSIEAGKRPGLVSIPLFDWESDRLKAESRPVRLI